MTGNQNRRAGKETKPGSGCGVASEFLKNGRKPPAQFRQEPPGAVLEPERNRETRDRGNRRRWGARLAVRGTVGGEGLLRELGGESHSKGNPGSSRKGKILRRGHEGKCRAGGGTRGKAREGAGIAGSAAFRQAVRSRRGVAEFPLRNERGTSRAGKRLRQGKMRRSREEPCWNRNGTGRRGIEETGGDGAQGAPGGEPWGELGGEGLLRDLAGKNRREEGTRGAAARGKSCDGGMRESAGREGEPAGKQEKGRKLREAPHSGKPSALEGALQNFLCGMREEQAAQENG